MMPSHRPLSSLLPRALVALVMLAAAGCNAKVSNPAAGLSIVGNYRLVSVNGLTLPARTASGYVVRGSLNLGSSTNYTLSETDSSAGQTSVFNSSGTWSIFGSQVTFLGAGNATYFGTFSAQLDTISIPINGHTSVYTR
jgi:hypothetical protein